MDRHCNYLATGQSAGHTECDQCQRFEFIRKYNTMTILNIVECVPRVHHVYRKRNTIHMLMDKRNITMTDDLHVGNSTEMVATG